MSSLLKMIRSEARAWWHHKNLREAGRTAEAREAEHPDMRGTVRNYRAALQAGAVLHIGHKGWSFQIGEHKADWQAGTNSTTRASISNYGQPPAHYVEFCRRNGFTIIDTRGIDPLLSIRAPMIALGLTKPDAPREDGSYGSMDYAPLAYVAAWYSARGAKVENAPN